MALVAVNKPGPSEPASAQAGGSFQDICWNLVFTEPRCIQFETENTPLLEVLVAYGSEHEHEVGSRAWVVELENGIRDFMRGNESDICTPEADTILGFLSESSFERFFQRELTGDKASQQVAFLDERNFQHNGDQARAQKGPLTALELYDQLKKPVSHSVSESEPP